MPFSNIAHTLHTYNLLFFRYVFKIYQTEPNAAVNNGLIVPETNKLTITCDAGGRWSPENIPECICKINRIQFVNSVTVLCCFDF